MTERDEKYHTVREHLKVPDLDTVAEQVATYILEDPKITESADFHARQTMVQSEIDIPEHVDDCDIYWTLYTEYQTMVLVSVLGKLSPKV